MDKDEKRPTKILFVCLGNICRSPAAEGVMKRILEEKGLANNFIIDSAGLGNWHTGDLPDSRMRDHALRRGLKLTHRARQITRADLDYFDMIIGMDDENMRALHRMASPFNSKKIVKMTDFSQIKPRPVSVPDPYYGTAKDFDYALDLLEDACSGLIEYLTQF